MYPRFSRVGVSPGGSRLSVFTTRSNRAVKIRGNLQSNCAPPAAGTALIPNSGDRPNKQRGCYSTLDLYWPLTRNRNGVCSGVCKAPRNLSIAIPARYALRWGSDKVISCRYQAFEGSPQLHLCLSIVPEVPAPAIQVTYKNSNGHTGDVVLDRDPSRGGNGR